MTTVFLTGAGGAAVPFLINHLRARGHRVIVGDMDPYATGLYLADKGYVIPAGISKEFISTIQMICQQEHVRVFVPLVDEELIPACDLENNGIIVLLPRKHFIALCLDKYALSTELERHNIEVPQTYLMSEFTSQISFPYVIKPRTGRGSRGVSIIASPHDLDVYRSSTLYTDDELIVQEYLSGTEYTVSVVVGRDGFIHAIIPKEIMHKKGITKMAVTRHHERIDNVCRKIQSTLQAHGPFNVQLRLDRYDNPSVFEINPRFSTSITLTIAAGVDEIGLLVDAACGIQKLQPTEWHEGIVLMRQSVDTFYGINEFADRKKNIAVSEL